MNRLVTRIVLSTAVGLALTVTGCGHTPEDPGLEPTTPPLPLSPALVSEAVAPVASGTDVAFVSLTPGSVPSGRLATIRNPANGRNVSVLMVDGGWDPVPIAARSGDTLRITIATEQGVRHEYIHPVPPSRPPVILRTDPPHRKRDVALNAVLMVVFSEPIDPATLGPGTVQLLHDGQPVDLDVRISNDGLRMTIEPEEELAPGTEYVLVVLPDLADLTGDHLQERAEVGFRTLMGFAVKSLAYVRGTTVYVDPLDGTAPLPLVTGASRPTWSPDGAQLAFTRPTGNTLARWELCITSASGDNTRCATGGANADVIGGPAWSPDGSTIAFSIYVHNCLPSGYCGEVNGSNLTLLNTATMKVEMLDTPPVRSISWSPDGRKIALTVCCVGPTSQYGLATINPDGTQLEILVERFDSYTISGATWSPDGKQLALALSDENVCPWYCDTAVGVIDANGTGLRILDRAHTADQVYLWTTPAWSPDGSVLAYTTTRGGCELHHAACNEIRVVSPQGGRSNVLVNEAALPSWRR